MTSSHRGRVVFFFLFFSKGYHLAKAIIEIPRRTISKSVLSRDYGFRQQSRRARKGVGSRNPSPGFKPGEIP